MANNVIDLIIISALAIRVSCQVPVLPGYIHSVDLSRWTSTGYGEPANKTFVLYYGVIGDYVRLGLVAEVNYATDWIAFGQTKSLDGPHISRDGITSDDIVIGKAPSPTGDPTISDFVMAGMGATNKVTCAGSGVAICPDSGYIPSYHCRDDVIPISTS